MVASGLDHPWGLALLPDGRWLVTERSGKLSIIGADGAKGPAIAGLPAVVAKGQGGLFDVAVGPTFAQDRMIYWSFAEARDGGGNATSLARGRLSDDGTRVENVQVIFRALPAYDGDKHFGWALAFAPDGKLFLTLGERSDKPMRPQAQDLGSHMGKVIRINADGSVPQDNPFVGRAGALPESGAWATATFRASPSRRTARSGPSNTARAAATRSTWTAPASTTAGPTRPMASNTRAGRSTPG